MRSACWTAIWISSCWRICSAAARRSLRHAAIHREIAQQQADKAGDDRHAGPYVDLPPDMLAADEIVEKVRAPVDERHEEGEPAELDDALRRRFEPREQKIGDNGSGHRRWEHLKIVSTA